MFFADGLSFPLSGLRFGRNRLGYELPRRFEIDELLPLAAVAEIPSDSDGKGLLFTEKDSRSVELSLPVWKWSRSHWGPRPNG